MTGAHARFIVCLAIGLLPAMAVYGQSTADDPLSIKASNVSAVKIGESGADPAGARAKLILAHGSDNDPRYSANRPAPAYAEAMGSRVGQLSVDWVLPKSILVNQESDFELVVRNRGPVAVQDIRIEPVLPADSRLTAANPSPGIVDQQPVWQITSLDPQEEFRIKLSLILNSTGPAFSDARITYSTSTSTAFSVVEPKLEITAEGPESIIVGDQLFFHVTVTNPGTGPTENTSLKVLFPNGIERVAESDDYDLGILNPGESRSLRIAGNMSQLGEHMCGFVVTSDHGLRDETSSRVLGLGAKIDIDIDGPAFRYVNRPAEYVLRIANHGTAPASDLYIRSAVPRPFAFLQADHSGSFDAVNKNITWFVDQLNAGEELEVSFRLQATTPGSFPILAEAAGERGLLVSTNHTTNVEGIAAILLEVVDVDDPVEVGVETFYEIIVTNQGTAFANDVIVTAEVPQEMEITGSKGPSEGSIQGRTIRFELAKLAPRADAIFRVKVRGLQAKDVRIRVQVEAESLDEPVLELESTKVYRD